MNFQYIVRSILALIIIIWLANQVLKKLNDHMQGQSPSIEVIERFSINKNSSLALVKVIESYYLMSLNENKNEILKELTSEEVELLLNNLEKEQLAKKDFLTKSFNISAWKEKYRNYFEGDQK